MKPELTAADAAIPAQHPLAQHLRRSLQIEQARPRREWAPEQGPMPALFISHGAPPLLEDAEWMAQLHSWGLDLPRPRAILIVSAHWESNSLGVTSTAATDLVYDFGGFDPLYYTLRYDTPDSSALLEQLRAVLPRTASVHEHTRRGLDHGAWVPLKAMYPRADVPVLQLSLPLQNPDGLLALGERLRELRQDGVLVIGSGFMTHGLAYLNWRDPTQIPAWSRDFDAWAQGALQAGDLEALTRYESTAPGLPFAHPTAEHFLPLFVTLGARSVGETMGKTIIDGYMMGLSRRSIEVA